MRKIAFAVMALAFLGAANSSGQGVPAVPKQAPASASSAFSRADSSATHDSISRAKKSRVKLPAFLPQSAAELDAYIANSKGYLFVEFGTPWCGPCKAMVRDLPPLMEEILSVDGEYLSLYTTDGKGLQGSRLVGAKEMMFEEADFSSLLAGATRASNAVAKLRNLSKDGDRALVTFDGSSHYWAVRDGETVRLYRTCFFTTGGRSSLLIPFWALFLDGQLLVRGASYSISKESFGSSINMCQGKETLRFVLKFVEEHKRGPAPEELPRRCDGLMQKSIAMPP